MEPPPSGQEAPRAPATEQPEGRPASRLLVSFQYVHVQLAGGAPWGFTLKGGLEHGEPLIVSKVEDGGKAALSQKIRSGDELVNINGTPLYGSRQEALILIKGSYRTLKMIIRRRNIPVIRPHSWHLAKLFEARTEAAAMPCPADAFSLSWHSGCDTSDLSLPWPPLSRHCSTDKSSSLGSMESLEPPSQTSYYEGSLSPIDQAMDHPNKRDSAYSSFSASSTASDSALRPEENAPSEGGQRGLPPDPRYLQTGSEGGGSSSSSSEPSGQRSSATPPAPSPRPASGTPASPLASFAKAATPAPQPPVRQDSLQACNPPPEVPRADPLRPKGRWTSDTSLCTRGRDPPGPCEPLASARHAKGSLSTDQYYLFSSHMESQAPPMEKGGPSPEPLLDEQDRAPPLDDSPLGGERNEQEGELVRPEVCSPSAWEAGWAGPLGHRHSAPERLLSAQLQALKVAPRQESPRWTMSPLHSGQRSPSASEPWQDGGREEGSRASPGGAEESDSCPEWGAGPCPPQGRHTGHERPRSASVDLASPLPRQPPDDATDRGFPPACPTYASREGAQDGEGGSPAPRKGGPGQHRSAQMRRRSDRFATNLRHEIQWRKAQLQKAKGSAQLLGREGAVEELEEPPSCSPGSPSQPTLAPAPAPPPPPPPVKARPHGFGARTRRWGSELSVFVEDSPAHSPGRGLPAPEPRWGSQELGPVCPPKPGRSGRWRWSPEHKLQPHDEGSQVAQPEPSADYSDDSGLLPFADRRKFFEETSKPLPSGYANLNPHRLRRWPPPWVEEPKTFQPVGSEHQALRHHSLDQGCRAPSPPTYPDFHREALGFCPASAHHRGDCDWWQPLPCSGGPREACAHCYAERCPALHQRNLPVPTGHCARHCHPRPAWSHCSDCCCLAPHKRLEEAVPWPPRKEFPLDEWEPPPINRKNSQSMSALAPHKMGVARVNPFWTCFESTEPEWAPFGRTTSTRNLSWDCERPSRTVKNPPHQEPGELPLRERAYSESHLCVEPAGGAARREPREAPPSRLEESWREPPGRAKKKGPPPPRPPPPNWEKYHLRHTSQGSPSAPPEDPSAPDQHSHDAGRQRSQSLPAKEVWKEAALRQPHLTPQEFPSPSEPSSLHYYSHKAPHRTPERPPGPPVPTEPVGSSRPVGSLEEKASPELQWPKESHGAASRTRVEGGPAGDARNLPSPEPAKAFPGAAPESGALAPSGPPAPSRLNSEELMREVAGQDRSLAGVLGPAVGRVTATEVMGDLFSPSNSPAWTGWDQPPQPGGGGSPERQPPQPPSLACGGGTPSPPAGSLYYSTSTGKAKLADQAKGTLEPAGGRSEEEEELDQDLAQKKVQLIESISQKLAVLQEAQRGLQEDLNANVALGKDVENHVKGACKSQEYEKFRLFIGDLDKVVNLLLSLSGRLARVENTLGALDPDAPEEEKLALVEKKRQLASQLEDAKELQEHVARRERAVFASVSRRLPSEQLQDYQHFVRMKSALAIQQRQLDDKIKLGQEQLRCLRESLSRGGWEH